MTPEGQEISKASILIIGDVHGKVEEYSHLIEGREESIQLGDFGFKKEHDWFIANVAGRGLHRILFGNHDYIPNLFEDYSLGNYSCLLSGQVFAIRGADSIDKRSRIVGRDWWPEEEIDLRIWDAIIGSYRHWRPRVVLSHDCPQSVREQLFGIVQSSRTSQGLQACLDIHRPELWVFGHHHRSLSETIDGTTFRCLAELETMEIEL